MKIIISARPGSGKTTLVKKLASKISIPACGFYTEEILKNGTRVSFKAVSLEDREEIVLAHIDIQSPYRVGRYKVNVKDFQPMAVEVLGNALKGDETLVIIDEIGKMELFSPEFRELILEVLDSPKTVLVTLKTDWAEEWLAKIKDKDTHHFQLTRGNFEQVFTEIFQLITAQKA